MTEHARGRKVYEKGMKKRRDTGRAGAKTRQCGKKANAFFQASAYKCMELPGSLHSAWNTINFVFTSFSAPRDRPCSLTPAREKFVRSLTLARRALL